MKRRGLRVRVVEVLQPEVEGTVEHHRADGRGEHLRVRRSDDGAVGESEVVELRLAERDADGFEIARGVARADLSRIRAVPFGAPRCESGVVRMGDRERSHVVGDRRGDRAEVEVGVVDTVDRA